MAITIRKTKMNRRRAIVRATVAIYVLTGAVMLCAQGNAPPPIPQAQPIYQEVPAIPTSLASDLSEPAAPDSYILGNGDLVDVFVFQMPDLTRQLRIDSHGEIRLPLTSRPVHANGLTAPALASALKARLHDDGIAHDPQVDVIVRQIESKPVVVAGAVKNPITLELARPTPLVEVIARAGGLAPNSGNVVILSSRGADGTMTNQSFEASDVITGSDTQGAPMLVGGEIVRVPPAQFVYSLGAFTKPGAFPVSDGEKLTVLKTLSLSEGMKDQASPQDAVIMRVKEGVVRAQIPVDLRKMLKHQASDVELQAGDVLYLPNSGRKQLLSQVIMYSAQAATLAIGYTLGR